MNKIALSLGTVVALSSFGVAGGDIAPVEPAVAAVYAPADESNFYIGIGGAATKASSSGSSFTGAKSGQDRLGSVALLAGYNFNRYFAVEGRYLTSFTQEDVIEMDNLSIFAKPQYPVNEQFSLYALLGYGTSSIDGTNGAVVDVDESGFQWGLGLNYEIGNNTSIFLDYTSLGTDLEGTYFDGKRDVDTEAVTVGVTYKF